jgi:hypothetical protein
MALVVNRYRRINHYHQVAQVLYLSFPITNFRSQQCGALCCSSLYLFKPTPTRSSVDTGFLAALSK